MIKLPVSRIILIIECIIFAAINISLGINLNLKFKKIFAELLEGEPLPLLTSFSCEIIPYILYAFVFGMIFISIYKFKQAKTTITLCICVFLIHIILYPIAIAGAFLSLIQIIDKLGT